MAFVLSFSKTGNEDFVGKVGDTFTIDMIGPPRIGLVIVACSYGGNTLQAPPFAFQIAKATDYLFLHFEALVPGSQIQVVEVAGSANQLLDTKVFNPDGPGVGYLITGN